MPFGPIDPSTAESAPTTDAGAPLTSVGMTLADYRESVLLALGNRSDVTNPMLDKWVNQAYSYIAGIIDIKELWASISIDFLTDQPFYEVPEVLAWIKRISLLDDTDYLTDEGIELEMIDEQTYRTLPESGAVQLSGSSIPPRAYFRYGRIYVIWPTPATDYTGSLDFRVRPLKLVDPTDSPILPEDFHVAIEQGAIWRARRGLRQWKEAALAQNDMLTELRPWMNTDAEETDAMHMVAQPVRSTSELYRYRRY